MTMQPESTPFRTASSWEAGNLRRVPYWVYDTPEVLALEQRRVFEGPVWNFLGLEAEIPNPGDFKTTFVGRMPVILSRDSSNEIYAFENRCAHRGALIALEDRGNARDHVCVYHAWRYDLQGNLQGVAFEDGVQGKGGMPPGFRKSELAPRKLRTTVFCGLVFGSLHEDVLPIEESLGDVVLSRLERVLSQPVEVIGRFTQDLPNNWKLYAENVRDTYHASLLHTFFTTFGVTRLTQGGGVMISEEGGSHASASYSELIGGTESAYLDQGIRSDNTELQLEDLSFLRTVDEFGDGINLQILSVFPGFVLQQIHNCIAVRQVLPRGVDRTDLHWTYLGFRDDTAEMRELRLKQANLIGPAGFVSLEDGAIGGFVQRGIDAAQREEAFVELGGHEASTQEFRATEAAVRGFWKAWRHHTAL